ncbi:hypothetical protein C5Y93_05875 [Blastopirellula marina]|uniref:WD40 repeat domain-containing protein n=2 Tax=Blastopirellula marina TaxID=124 RepID=A0A2S8GRM1_9BACT|nr:hypothetical protein C5Y93_05875 [Blastopirellula marina]
MLFLLPASGRLHAEESTAEVTAIVDRLSQKVLNPIFHEASTFETAPRQGELVDISVDGSRMIMLQRDKKISTWNVEEGKKLAEFSPKEDATDGILKISRDGKWGAFANQRRFVEVWEVETGKLVHTFDEMDWKIGDLGFSQDSKLVFALGTQRQLLIAKPDGEVIRHEPEAVLEEERRVRMCNFGQDRWATVIERKDDEIVELVWEMPEENGRVELPRRNPPNIVGGPGFFIVFSGNEFWAGPYTNNGTFFSTTQQWIRDIRIDSIEPTNQANYAWISTWHGAEVRGSWRLGELGQMIVPLKYDPQVLVLPAPNSKRMISHAPGGQTTVFALEEDAEIRPSAYRTLTILDKIMGDKNYEVINAVGKLWEDRLEPITDNKLTTAYSELVTQVRNFRDAPRNAEEQAKWLANLVEEHPDNDVFRLALANQYHRIGTEARGSGYAYKVSPEGWMTLDKYMQKSWETIEPMLERKQVPPETFVELVIVARFQDWPRERLSPYLERAIKEAPTYHRIWKQACMSRLPRWGGAEGEAEALAAQVADHIGGKDGDILYAEVARLLYIFLRWKGLVDEAGFDQDRIMRGMVGICERAPNAYAENLALQFANEFKNHAGAHQVALLVQQRNHTYIHRLWEYDHKKYEEVLAWALAEAPPEEKTETAEPSPQQSPDEADANADQKSVDSGDGV